MRPQNRSARFPLTWHNLLKVGTATTPLQESGHGRISASSYRAMIPLLKKLGFIDPANVPTQAYKDFREDSLSGTVMAERLREAYKSLFQANEYVWKLSKGDLAAKLKSLTGAADDEQYIPSVAGTFLATFKIGRLGRGMPKRKESTSDDAGKGGSSNSGRKRDEEFADGRLMAHDRPPWTRAPAPASSLPRCSFRSAAVA